MSAPTLYTALKELVACHKPLPIRSGIKANEAWHARRKAAFADARTALASYAAAPDSDARRLAEFERALEAEKTDRVMDRYGMQDGSLLRDLRSRISHLEARNAALERRIERALEEAKDYPPANHILAKIRKALRGGEA